MRPETYRKADEIINRQGVLIKEVTPNFVFFVVEGSSGWHDVYYKKQPEEWVCNSLNKKEKWGCVMNNPKDRTRPFCSHTLASKIKMQRMRILMEANNNGDNQQNDN